MKRLLMIEFNEICLSLVDRWANEGLLPNFSRLREQSHCLVTASDTDDPVHLEPWIQWYSIHTGVPCDRHGVFHLTDGPGAGFDDVWTMLRAANRTVACGGSMNAKGFADPNGFFLPDPWCNSEPADPPALNAYQRFVSALVQQYTNTTTGLDATDYARVMAFLATHGLKPGTVREIVAQLASERLGDSRVSWRRALLLDRLQFDVFSHYYRSRRPDFATFFVNSVAHLQHTYWRNMAPEQFASAPDASEQAVYAHAIRDGYQAMDRLLGDLIALAGPHCTIVLASALSQQPFLRHEGDGGQRFYRPHDARDMLARLSIVPRVVQPTMTHQFMLRFDTADACRDARQRLADCRLEGQPLFDIGPELASDCLHFGNGLWREVDPNAMISDRRNMRSHRFGDLFYQMEAIKSGCHHPDGLLWLRTERPIAAGEGKVSILDILPTVLSLLDVPVPAQLDGRSLVHDAAMPLAA